MKYITAVLAALLALYLFISAALSAALHHKPDYAYEMVAFRRPFLLVNLAAHTVT